MKSTKLFLKALRMIQSANVPSTRFYIASSTAAAGFAFYQYSQQIKNTAECAPFKDKFLDSIVQKIDNGIEELQKVHPGMQNVKINSGLRGTRYFIEFPIISKNVDAYSLFNQTRILMEQSKQTFGVKITNKDSYLADENVAYLLDYSVDSSQILGTKTKGSVYIRGVKGQDGWDSFKFILEKSNDFSDFDAQLVLNAYEQALKPKPGEVPQKIDETGMTPAQIKFAKRQAAKQNGSSLPVKGSPLDSNSQSQNENDPVSVLEKHSCSVFLPHTQKHQLDWDYLAGYEHIKRDIEDTVLLALTHGDIYDKITAATRMKNETNRPKCILFEGPPGCGKTTSAKIISQQVEIPLVYMPLEAIMSKYYGESESRLAEIFEASAAMGSVILFIDEIDSLATSREAGLHEATRRILSTLLRKIDSFESDGEVLVICATNRKKDLDPALISRLDLSIRFELPDAKTRAAIFKRYAKQLSDEDLDRLGELSIHLSGRDISDICKDAERKWASKYIRKEVKEIVPNLSVYIDATANRLTQMGETNLRMDGDFNPHLIAQRLKSSPMTQQN